MESVFRYLQSHITASDFCVVSVGLLENASSPPYFSLHISDSWNLTVFIATVDNYKIYLYTLIKCHAHAAQGNLHIVVRPPSRCKSVTVIGGLFLWSIKRWIWVLMSLMKCIISIFEPCVSLCNFFGKEKSLPLTLKPPCCGLWTPFTVWYQTWLGRYCPCLLQGRWSIFGTIYLGLVWKWAALSYYQWKYASRHLDVSTKARCPRRNLISRYLACHLRPDKIPSKYIPLVKLHDSLYPIHGVILT